MRMNRAASFLLALASPACALSQPTPALINPVGSDAKPPAAAAAAGAGDAIGVESDANAVLDALNARGKDLRDFTADVALAELDATTGEDPLTRSGKIWFKNKDPRRAGDDARMRVTFASKKRGKILQDEKLEYKLEDGWLWERDYHKKSQIKRQVLRPGEHVNLLKVGEGPFPLPIGQERADVLEQFDVKKVAPAAGDPPQTVHLTLKPKSGTKLARKFAQIDVWVDVKTRMPVRIEAEEKGGTTRTTELKNVKVNAGLTNDDFVLPPVEGWNEREEPYGE